MRARPDLTAVPGFMRVRLFPVDLRVELRVAPRAAVLLADGNGAATSAVRFQQQNVFMGTVCGMRNDGGPLVRWPLPWMVDTSSSF